LVHFTHAAGADLPSEAIPAKGLLLVCFLYRCNEAVTSLGKCFDIPRRVRIIAQGRSHFPDAQIQPMLKINESFASPDLLPQLFPRNQLAWTRSKQHQDFRGLRA